MLTQKNEILSDFKIRPRDCNDDEKADIEVRVKKTGGMINIPAIKWSGQFEDKTGGYNALYDVYSKGWLTEEAWQRLWMAIKISPLPDHRKGEIKIFFQGQIVAYRSD